MSKNTRRHNFFSSLVRNAMFKNNLCIQFLQLFFVSYSIFFLRPTSVISVNSSDFFGTMILILLSILLPRSVSDELNAKLVKQSAMFQKLQPYIICRGLYLIFIQNLHIIENSSSFSNLNHFKCFFFLEIARWRWRYRGWTWKFFKENKVHSICVLNHLRWKVFELLKWKVFELLNN